MSTRAIVGYKKANGEIVGVLVWCDAFPDNLGRKLRSNFKTFSDIEQLIAVGEMESICSEAEKQHLEELFPDQMKRTKWIKHKNIYMHQLPHHLNRGPETYKDLNEARDQDINYVYLFNKKTNKWVTYK